MKRLGPSGILFATVIILAALQFDYAARARPPLRASRSFGSACSRMCPLDDG